MTDLPRDFSHLTSRPEPDERLFNSLAIDEVVLEVSKNITDPILRRMFQQCMTNTLDTTTYYHEDVDGKPDTIVVTGDIPAMWSRDSWAQFKHYLPFVNREPKLQKAFAGLVIRQTENVLIDPFANAFVDPYVDNPPKTPHWPEGDQWHKGVWERKYELDSLAAFFCLSHSYYDKTKDSRPYDDRWIQASVTALDVVRSQQKPMNRHTLHKLHKATLSNGEHFPAIGRGELYGHGEPSAETGMSRSMFRPSDDEMELPYHIPSNAMTVVAMTGMARILKNMSEKKLSREFMSTAHEIDQGIQSHGFYDHPKYGCMYRYETDGFESQRLMDDPNVPSLLSLPYLGYAYRETPKYQATREFIFSDDNPYYANGERAEGLTSPHTGLDKVWPIATIMRIMTSDDDKEIKECLLTLRDTTHGTFFMHESINVDEPGDYTRPWFGWANSLFGEMILDLNERKPHILSQKSIAE